MQNQIFFQLLPRNQRNSLRERFKAMNNIRCKSRSILYSRECFSKMECPKNTRPKNCADICAFVQSLLIYAWREFTWLRIRDCKEERGKKWPGFCIADSIHTLEAQGCRARVQRRKELSVGKYARPPGLPRKIWCVHGVIQRLLLGSLSSVQKLY